MWLDTEKNKSMVLSNQYNPLLISYRPMTHWFGHYYYNHLLTCKQQCKNEILGHSECLGRDCHNQPFLSKYRMFNTNFDVKYKSIEECKKPIDFTIMHFFLKNTGNKVYWMLVYY